MRFSSASKVLAVLIGYATLTMVAGCKGGGVEGTYGDPNAGTFIVLKSGGKATFTAMNQPADCTYTVKDKNVSLDCNQGSPLELTVSEDGTTLMMPPGSLMPNMKKTK